MFFPKSRSLHLGGEHRLHYKKQACQNVRDVEADCNYQEIGTTNLNIETLLAKKGLFTTRKENQHNKNLNHISRMQIKSNLA